MELIKELLKLSISTTPRLKEVQHIKDDYYVIKLEPQEGTKWIAGEHGRFIFSDKTFKKRGRTFSIASAPEEKEITLGIRTGSNPSDFKKELINMAPGDPITMKGPFGFFKEKDETTPMVLIALGLGITPIRALLVSLKNQTTRKITLIYASKDHTLFADELERISTSNPLISLIKEKHSDEVISILKELGNQYKNEAYYYISGPPSAIVSIKKELRQLDIKKSRFISDPFFGYGDKGAAK